MLLNYNFFKHQIWKEFRLDKFTRLLQNSKRSVLVFRVIFVRKCAKKGIINDNHSFILLGYWHDVETKLKHPGPVTSPSVSTANVTRVTKQSPCWMWQAREGEGLRVVWVVTESTRGIVTVRNVCVWGLMEVTSCIWSVKNKSTEID